VRRPLRFLIFPSLVPLFTFLSKGFQTPGIRARNYLISA